jgi:hypothetical protein
VGLHWRTSMTLKKATQWKLTLWKRLSVDHRACDL